jgi:perosamine synthetase
MGRLVKIARARGIPVIGDAAQAHGATYHRKPVGAFADVTAFSFHGSKLVTTGEGGMLVTSRKRLAARARYLGNHASDASRHYWHDEIGFNYRLTNLQAALGLAQLTKVRKALAGRRRIMEWYRAELGERPDLELNPVVSSSRSACWLVCGILPEDGRSVPRVRALLARDGIETRPVFPPVNSMPPFREYPSVGACGVTRMLSARGIVLPTGGNLRRSDVRFIIKKLLRAVG